MEADRERCNKLVWEIDRKLHEDGVRLIILPDRAETCWQPRVEGLTTMVTASATAGRWRMSGSTK